MAIQSNRKRIRREYAPLNISVSLVCTTPASPITQTFDALCEDGSQYSPDRSLFPTVLAPVICAESSATVVAPTKKNSILSEIKWLANGQDITLDSSWSGKYNIDTADNDDKGTLSIYRNISVGEQVSLVMEAVIADSRTGFRHKIITEPVILNTIARSEDAYSVELPEGDRLLYSVFDDRLAKDDYNRAHGLKSMTDSDRALVQNERSSYMRQIPFQIRRGAKAVKSATNLKVEMLRVNSDGSLTRLDEKFSEMYSSPSVTASALNPAMFDMRLIERGCYMIRVLLGTKEVARRQFQIDRQEEDIDITPTNAVGIDDADTEHGDYARVSNARGCIIDRPEVGLNIKWYTSSSAKSNVLHNEGVMSRIDLKKAGMINADGTPGAAEMEVWCEAEVRAAHKFLQINGVYLVDKSGDPYIMS